LKRFGDQVAIVTGAGSGIGRETARRLAVEGALVVVADRDGDGAEAVADEIAAAGGTAIATRTDVSVTAEVAAMTAAARASFGPVDVLVNNAAIAQGDDVLAIDEATWDEELAVDLKAAFLCAKEALPDMIERRRGAIVNIATVNALSALGQEAYSAAKAGLVSLTRSLAVRYGRYGVRANAVAPGTVRTAIWRRRLEKDPEVFEKLAPWYPLGRVGEPEDVAHAVLFLASDEAAWITGVVLRVDGGLLAGNYRMSRELQAEFDDD
jgi:meso-butanediol dehydrogenase/(S,S)-butanediol dehydrogenase/diacetyl reductase